MCGINDEDGDRAPAFPNRHHQRADIKCVHRSGIGRGAVIGSHVLDDQWFAGYQIGPQSAVKR
ncbi:hypothetical protein AB5I41_28840 [Sphingomonas sp. MMS24-JH45]